MTDTAERLVDDFSELVQMLASMNPHLVEGRIAFLITGLAQSKRPLTIRIRSLACG